ncbi:hypothetical protein [Paenibacillus thalictri]|uniref:Class I SAM-dependent methyltransferase n=1 Tax=Paenibacillus thalictri TaxID=2527873 RepID=A0A4Q9DPI0_9BACL|nr:hypothetical protein [Paenibacillus thalictri]TBL78223.1 hypothetical protein EYB31_15240 [Paenibacillus thalictri]
MKNTGTHEELQKELQQNAEYHRLEIQRLIFSALQQLQEPVDVAVFGTGHWTDIDLVQLAAYTNKVDYYDMGNTGSQAAVQNITGTLAHKISLKTNVDFIGLERMNFMGTLMEMLEKKADIGRLSNYLLDAYGQFEKAEPEAGKPQYDLVISSPVYTQLFFIDALLTLAPYLEQYDKPGMNLISQQLSSVYARCVQAYNRLLFGSVKPGGRVVLWTDIIKLDEQTQSVMDEMYMARTEKDRVRSLFGAFGQYGLPGAVAGIKDAFDRLLPEKTHFNTWLWPLSQDKQYLAAGMFGEPRKL